jgi:hypothetical protein
VTINPKVNPPTVEIPVTATEALHSRAALAEIGEALAGIKGHEDEPLEVSSE